ncbi:hypothetical protein PUW24_06120 [Paenibacillus urinalis]|uniref:Uncharacterized protein n=1 Tax=Paenibacillus urinalis TaxID=521520 RepID=A0AAX3MYT1_9BACL|nr:hypothetical protein [Paenibacillus urinalis]WDH82442.1 hypothetical protein PUW23_23850 [Paenibacillus urinalis]WDH98499.1 hypothetical protein PUW24_06120 [Paenibacillus urinalis]WDI02190.1 hypothetical protein PUW25_23845 [Paenibacillus urinalis]
MFEEEQSSNGASTFIFFDQDVKLDDLLKYFEDEGRLKDDTLTISIIPSQDEAYQKERSLAEENPASKIDWGKSE